MGHDGDDLVSLPAPPPPNPAARRSAIDTALRKFDGIEEAPAARRKPPFLNWASTHRRAAGGLVTAALVAVIAVPVMQKAQREPTAVSEKSAPAPSRSVTGARPAAPSTAPPSERPDRPLPPEVLPNEPHDTAPAVAVPRGEVAAKASRAEEVPTESLDQAPSAPAFVPAPPAPPPPPPPPPPAPERQAAGVSDADNVVVTGSRMKRANQESAAPVAVMDPFGDFLLRLQTGLAANDRRAVIALVGYPLRVNWNGDTRTYRTREDVERDFDRIFSPSIRQSLGNQLVSRDNGRLVGNGRIWFGCGARSCSSAATIRLREVNP